MSATTKPQTASLTVRALTPDDLESVVAIDAAAEGRTRRDYLERRLQSAQRDPGAHAQFAAVDADGLAGFLLARVLQGEFGRRTLSLRIENVGVRPALRGLGAGWQLFAALSAWGARRGATEIHTMADWRRAEMLRWFDRLGFQLSSHHVVEYGLGQGSVDAEREPAVALDAGAAREVDYGRDESNDAERLARDRVAVRTMASSDLDAVVRIDREITGGDRRTYIAARHGEALADAALRISLTAQVDGATVGFLMARADLGDFGRTEPVAVIDTLGVDPGYKQHGVGRALMSQLCRNLGALRVERVETVVEQRNLGLLGFLYANGFGASPRLVFTRKLDPQ